MYTGVIDLEGFEQFIASSIHPIVYNGDITTIETFTEISLRFPIIDKWMIGRGAISNPLLAEAIRGILTNAEVALRIRGFHDELFKAYRECIKNQGNVIDKMKGVWFYLAEALPESKTTLKRIQKVRRLSEYMEITDGIFLSREVATVLNS
jgi:tRNA-dihydrouridine synthase